MLTEICQELKNWFEREKYIGTFTIEGGSIELPFLVQNQYYRIIGSLFNDGVHKYGDTSDVLTDETFDGAVWSMSVPPDVVALDSDIDAWKTKYAEASTSPYASESFGGYSYTIASGGNAQGSGYGGATWQNVFRSKLNKWRKI